MTLVAEAKNQGYIGMLAVAEVIRTRAKLRHLSYDEVALQKWQFSCWNNPQEGFRQVYDLVYFKNEKQMEDIHNTARKAWIDSATTNVTKGADLYHATYVKPDWNWSKTRYITAIGKHLFYKEIK
jgi:spore germination cell wall hydrolase CwlJ-like protein